MNITEQINTLANTLNNGGVFAYPTESVWGLGCDPFNESAVMKLLALKDRPLSKGVILVGADVAMVAPLLKHLPHAMQTQIIDSWSANSPASQQAITWLIPLHFTADKTNHAKSIATPIPKWITGKHESVAIRVTPHPLVQKLCQAFGGLIVSTSCNPAGETPAKDLHTAKSYFGNQIDYLEAETLGYTAPSKIIDALTNQVIRSA